MVFVLLKLKDGYKFMGVYGSQRQAEEYIKSLTGEGYYDLKDSNFIITKQV